MLVTKRVPLYVENPKLISSLFSFIFELPSRYVDDVITIDINEESSLCFYQKKDHDNKLVIELEKDALEFIDQKILLFSFKNNGEIKVKKSEKDILVLLDNSVVVSFI